MFTIIWTDHALQDLDTIYIFLTEKSQQAANQLIFKILDRVKQLEEFPESGQEQLLPNTGTFRYLVEGNYKIMYEFEKEAVFILTVFDTRQNPEKLKLH